MKDIVGRSQRREARQPLRGFKLAIGLAVLMLGGTIDSLGAAGPFTEQWTGTSSPYFVFHLYGGSSISSGVSDAGAQDGKVVRLTLPAFPGPGPGGGPNLQSPDLYGFGTYEARLKAADCSTQPTTGAITGFFTFLNDGTDQNGNGIRDNSEIDFEWLCAEPNVIWLTQWTDYQESPSFALKRIMREIDLASGTIRQTCYSEAFGACTQDLTGSATEGVPSTISAIPGYNSATAYYTYGFTWQSNRITWYIIHPTNGQKVILWDYRGPVSRITQRPAYYMANLWHTNSWAPPGIGATSPPNSPRHLNIDWAKFSTGTGPTPTPCTSCTPVPTPSPAPCYPAWVWNRAYGAGERVTHEGQNYEANYGTYNENPAQFNGPPNTGKPWRPLGPCTAASPTARPTTTATSRPRATATARPTSRPTATARPRATSTPAPSNLIQNPELDQGTLYWSLESWNGASGSLAAITGAGLSGTNAARVLIGNSGSETWNIQLRQPLPITGNKIYTVAFMAKAGSARSMNVVVQQRNSPWNKYWTSPPVSLTTTAQSFSYSFTASATDADTMLEFYLGANTSTVYVDRVIVTAR